MCLAVPMKLIDLCDSEHGRVELEGSRQDVNISLIDHPVPGDYLIVHAGFAIEKLDREEADKRINLFKELAESQQASALS